MQRKYRFANVTFFIEFKYKYTEFLLSQYEINDEVYIDEYIKICKDDIEYERRIDKDTDNYPDEYIENIAMFRRVSEILIDYNTLTFHGSAVCFDNRAYIFTGKSGAGKSTYSKRCVDCFGDRIHYINDDKPFLNFENGIWTVYGTPWSGKHNRGENVNARLGGICFMCKGDNHGIEILDFKTAFSWLLGQVYRSEDAVRLRKVLSLVDKLRNINVFKTDFSHKEEYACGVLESMSAYN